MPAITSFAVTNRFHLSSVVHLTLGQSTQITVTSRLFLLMQSRVTLLVPPFCTTSPSCGDAGGPDAHMDCKAVSLCCCLDSPYNSHCDVCCSPWFRSLPRCSTGSRPLDGCMSLRSSNSSLFSTSASASSCLLRRSAPNRARMSHIKQDNCPWEDRKLQLLNIVHGDFSVSFHVLSINESNPSNVKKLNTQEGLTCHLKLFHFVLQLRLLLHHVSPLRVQPWLHLSPHLLHLAHHLCPAKSVEQGALFTKILILAEAVSPGNNGESVPQHLHFDAQLCHAVVLRLVEWC